MDLWLNEKGDEVRGRGLFWFFDEMRKIKGKVVLRGFLDIYKRVNGLF